MSELKMTWSEFCFLAMQSVARQYPQICEAAQLRFTREHTYEGEHECYELPQSVYVWVKDEKAQEG